MDTLIDAVQSQSTPQIEQTAVQDDGQNLVADQINLKRRIDDTSSQADQTSGQNLGQNLVADLENSQLGQLVSLSSSIEDQLNSIKNLKPKRQSFKKVVIIDNDGKTVNQETWAELVKGHHPGAVLKKQGLQKKVIFNKEEYEKTKNAFYVVKHAHEKTVVNAVINQAFEVAQVPKTKTTENVLSLMVLNLKKLPIKDAINQFVKVLKLVSHQNDDDLLA